MLRSVKAILIILFGASLVPPVFMLLNDVITGRGMPVMQDFFINMAYSIGPTVSLTAGCTLVITLLNKHLPWKKSAPLRLISELVIIVSLAIAVAFLFSYANPMVGDDVDPKELLNTNVFFNLIITLFIVTIVEASFFFGQWKQSRLESEELQKEHFKAQFQNLKNQINPHLLFNSLNALTSLIETDSEKAVQYVQNLSKYLRMVLNQSEEEAIELKTELSLLNNYYQLQRERFRDSFVLNINIPQSAEASLVPPLVLQMLVENAVKHNEISRQSPLVVTIEWKDGSIEVSNKKALKSIEGASTGVGLGNIASRYFLLAKKEIEVMDESESFRVRVPLLSMEADANTDY